MGITIAEPVIRHIIATLVFSIESRHDMLEEMIDDLDGWSSLGDIQDALDEVQRVYKDHQALDTMYRCLVENVEEQYMDGETYMVSRCRYNDGVYFDWLEELRNMKANRLGLTLEGDE